MQIHRVDFYVNSFMTEAVIIEKPVRTGFYMITVPVMKELNLVNSRVDTP